MWPSFFSVLWQAFNCSELVENDEAHPDLTEELDWYVRIANDYKKKVQYYYSKRVIGSYNQVHSSCDES